MTSEPRTYLSQNDTIMWTVEDDPLLRSTIVAVVLLDRAPEWDDLVARVDHASRMVPELREKVVTVPGHPGLLRWVPEPDLDLEYHLRRMAAPEPGRLPDVLRLARSFAASGFDRSKPLWEFTLVEGVVRSVDGAEVTGGAAFVMKSHHVVTDGVGAVQLASHLFDLSPDAPVVPTSALDAGVPLRDVQEAASHADPRTTMRYDRARVSLDRHATYIVSTFIAGAAR